MPGARLPEHPGPGGPGLGRANVLLVDDRAANLLALEEVLRPLGQHLVRATSGHEALRCLLRDDFAVILLDVHMPGLDGFETAAQIKQRERSRHIPIIFLTAVSRDPHQALQGYSAGAVDYLSTPFDPAVLRSKVSVFVDLYLERRRAQAAEQALSHQAFHDSLTKLPNRALLLDRLTHALARQERRPGDTAVLFVDIDRFKWVNDSLGHAVGDELLVAIAERLQTVVRAGDTVGRFGGDEFVVLCEELGHDEDVAAVAERLARAVGEPFEVHDQTIAVTASIGIALARAVGRDTAEALLRDADTAMYRAKERGRDGIEVFDQGMRSRVLVRLETAKSLRRAVDRGELRVHYQPVIELGTGAVVGVEALLRWEDPVRGLVPPSDFVPVAEENGLILPIGAFVLVEACRQVSRWNRAHPGRAPLTASVNLSARQLASDSLGPLVGEVLADSGLDPTTLCLEITESVLVEDVAANRSALESLRDLGVRVAVDDFGTGYSSLLYLRRFPIDVLKVDRAFVAGVVDSPEDGAIVTGVVGLAHALGLTAVAEGVESREQEAVLAAMGCDLAQGFLWSQALPGPAAGEWLEAALPAPGRAARVLVVDDDRPLRGAVRAALELDGWFQVVAEAADGAAAIDMARDHQPDLVLLDLAMPGVGGDEALPRILDVAPAAKVALLTAAEPACIAAATASSAVGCFEKGIDLDVMVGRLAAIVGR